nr:iron dependent repressor, metal binding and dimerization domain protein [Sedimentibacter sp.]
MNENNFYTFRGYSLNNEKSLSPSMEDYIEMIYRLSCEKSNVRVNDLSESLNVQPPSSSKMIKKLSRFGYVNYEKYGYVNLTEKGIELGKYLLNRHETIFNFLKLIGVDDNLLEQTEKIEHAINEETIKKMNSFILFINDNPEIYEMYLKEYIKENNKLL